MSRVQHVTTAPFRSQGGRLVATAGKELPLRAVELAAEAAGGIARTELRQVFSNPYDEPLKLTYQFPLPADGAVAGFEIRAGERVIRGEIDRYRTGRSRTLSTMRFVRTSRRMPRIWLPTERERRNPASISRRS